MRITFVKKLRQLLKEHNLLQQDLAIIKHSKQSDNCNEEAMLLLCIAIKHSMNLINDLHKSVD